MARIDVIGLGPADEKLLTAETLALIGSSKRGFVRTRRHPAAAVVGHFQSFDDTYESSENIDDVYRTIVESLIRAAVDEGEIVYAVPGSPLVAEKTVELLRERPDVEVVIHPAMSFLDLVWARVGIDPFSQSVTLIDAHENRFDHLSGAVCFGQCDSKETLSAIKLSVDDAGQQKVWVLQRLGLPDESVREVDWDDIDREVEPDHLTSIYVANYPVSLGSAFADLNDVVLRLRKECPWDAKQTHLTLTKYLLEEAYELIEAVGVFEEMGGYESDSADRADALAHLIEELGDVLVQVLLHSALGTEAGEFTVADVVSGLQAKLVHRHPHVFGDFAADTVEAVEANWEVLKEKEGKVANTELDVDGAMPSLSHASVLRDRIEKRGFYYMGVDWSLEDVKGEVEELRETLGESSGEISTEVFNEFGDVLFAAVNLGNTLGIDSEAALRATTARFRERFLRFEQLVFAKAPQISDLSESDLLLMWKAAKN